MAFNQSEYGAGYDYVPERRTTAELTVGVMPRPTAEAVRYTAFPKNISNAIAYIAFQENSDSYTENEGFEKGTMFPVLYKPFLGRTVGKG